MSAFHEYEAGMFTSTFFNLTDEKNRDVNNSGYGNGSIVPRMPLRGEFTIRKRF